MPRLLIGNIKGTKGDTGAQGERGLAGTVEIGSVQTVSYGSPASVTNSGTEEEAILDFQIPQGAPGATVTDMKNLVLGAITDSTADYPAFAVSETGSTIFGKIRKFLSDLKTNYVSKSMMTTSTNVETAGQYVADAAVIKTLNDNSNSLASDIDAINETLASHSYFTLVNGESVSNTQKTVTLHNGRKLSDYVLLLMLVKRGNYYRTSILMPRHLFTPNVGLDIAEVDSVNVQRWYDVAYISDTQVRIQSSTNVTDASIYLYGINI